MSMIISIMSVTAFVMMSVYMLVWSNFACTRRLAIIPCVMTGAELAMFGLLSSVSNPVVTVLLLALRVVMLAVCFKAMHADREAQKARKRLRQRFHYDLHNTMEPLRLMRRQRAAARIDIAA